MFRASKLNRKGQLLLIDTRSQVSFPKPINTQSYKKNTLHVKISAEILVLHFAEAQQSASVAIKRKYSNFDGCRFWVGSNIENQDKNLVMYDVIQGGPKIPNSFQI